MLLNEESEFTDNWNHFGGNVKSGRRKNRISDSWRGNTNGIGQLFRLWACMCCFLNERMRAGHDFLKDD